MSIAAQRKAIMDYAQRNGFVVVECFIDEGASARTSERAEFQKMIKAARTKPKPFDAILVHKTDRFARNREDAVLYKALLRRECGIEVISVTEQFDDSPTGRLLEGVMEVIAEFYSLNLSQEVKKGMREKASRGGKGLGMPPFGYRLAPSGHIIPVPEEARIVRFIFESYASGGHSLSSLANLMRTKGLSLFGEAALKLKWSTSGIRNMLKNPAYVGTLVWNRRENVQGARRLRTPDQWVVVEGSHEPIVSASLFRQANSIMASKGKTRHARSGDYLLKGLIFCGNCGGAMCSNRVTWELKRGITQYKRMLSCSRYHNARECYYNHAGMEQLTQEVMAALCSLLRGFVTLEDICIEPDPKAKRDANTEEKLNAIEAAFQRQFQAYEAGLISLAELKKAHERLNAERSRLLSDLTKERERGQRENEKLESVRRRVEVMLETLDDPSMPVSERRQAIKTVLQRVEYSQREDLLRIIIALP